MKIQLVKIDGKPALLEAESLRHLPLPEGAEVVRSERSGEIVGARDKDGMPICAFLREGKALGAEFVAVQPGQKVEFPLDAVGGAPR